MSSQEYIVSVGQINDGTYYALQHEADYLEREVLGLKQQRGVLAGHISDAMEQSSETWHDNAPADALFHDMRALDTYETRLTVASRSLEIVQYPTDQILAATIGSRILCSIANDEFLLDISGNLPVTIEGEADVEIGSISAPMPRALLGAMPGEIVQYEANGRLFNVSVLAIDQLAQQQYHTSSSMTSNSSPDVSA